MEKTYTLKKSYKYLPLLYLLIMLAMFFPFAEPLGESLIRLLIMASLIFAAGMSSLLQKIVLDAEGIHIKGNMLGAGHTFIAYTDVLRMELRDIGIQKNLAITRKSYKQALIPVSIYEKSEEMLSELNQHFPFDQNPVSLDIAVTQDLGKRPLYILIFAVLLFGLGLLLEKFFMTAWHGSSEAMFTWALYAIPAAIALSYAWIAPTKKAHSLLSSMIVGLILGGSLTHTVLVTNRWLNERSGQAVSAEFTLTEQGQRDQVWLPRDTAQFIFHDGHVRVHEVWSAGYNPKLEEGKTYRISVVKGRFNDIFFPVGAFHKAESTTP